MTRKVVILGGGGHARVILDIIRLSGDIPVAFLDDHRPESGELDGCPWGGKLSEVGQFPEKVQFFIALGNNMLRKKLAETIQRQWYVAIHPRAVVAASASIAPGSVVAAGAVLNAGVKIGRHCIVNTGSILEHGVTLGDFAHISSGCIVGGDAIVGAGAHLDIGTLVGRKAAIPEDYHGELGEYYHA